MIRTTLPKTTVIAATLIGLLTLAGCGGSIPIPGGVDRFAPAARADDVFLSSDQGGFTRVASVTPTEPQPPVKPTEPAEPTGPPTVVVSESSTANTPDLPTPNLPSPGSPDLPDLSPGAGEFTIDIEDLYGRWQSDADVYVVETDSIESSALIFVLTFADDPRTRRPNRAIVGISTPSGGTRRRLATNLPCRIIGDRAATFDWMNETYRVTVTGTDEITVTGKQAGQTIQRKYRRLARP